MFTLDYNEQCHQQAFRYHTRHTTKEMSCLEKSDSKSGITVRVLPLDSGRRNDHISL